jgi:hypothetical protein
MGFAFKLPAFSEPFEKSGISRLPACPDFSRDFTFYD